MCIVNVVSWRTGICQINTVLKRQEICEEASSASRCRGRDINSEKGTSSKKRDYMIEKACSATRHCRYMSNPCWEAVEISMYVRPPAVWVRCLQRLQCIKPNRKRKSDHLRGNDRGKILENTYVADVTWGKYTKEEKKRWKFERNRQKEEEREKIVVQWVK